MITKIGAKLIYDWDTPEDTQIRRNWLKQHGIKGDIGMDLDEVLHYPKGMTDEDKLNWYGYQRYGTDDWRPLHEKAEAERQQRKQALTARFAHDKAEREQKLRDIKNAFAMQNKLIRITQGPGFDFYKSYI